MDEELVTIADGAKDDVYLLLAFLEGNGFEVWQDQRSDFPRYGLVSVLKVKASDAERAMEFIDKIENSVPVDESEWQE